VLLIADTGHLAVKCLNDTTAEVSQAMTPVA